ncbi:hypothetical protein JCM3775_003613, partial [Rhodotorula graminis]
MPHTHTDHHSHTHAHPHSHSHDPDPDPHRTEHQHQATVQATFDLYKRHALAANQHRRADFYALPKPHRDLLPDYNALLREIDDKIAVNAHLVQLMADSNPFPPPPDAALDAPAPTEADHEGKPERDATYTPILAALDDAYADLAPSD